MHKWFLSAFILSLGLFLPIADAGKKSAGDTKEALQAFQEFIGNWKGTANEKNSASGRKSQLELAFQRQRHLADLRPRKQQSLQGRRSSFLAGQGTLSNHHHRQGRQERRLRRRIQKNVLVVERKNPDTNDTEQIKMNIAGGGDRLIYEVWIKPDGRTLFAKQLQVGYTREGVTFGVDSGGKKPECCVTGGLGTSTVSFGGATYYVCCSGCRDAFNENPAKVIAEFLKKKKR